jgi:hypothetical protein
MNKLFTALLAAVALLVGGVLLYQGLNPGFSIASFYHRYANTMERRANGDAKDYLKQILNDPDSYQVATNSVDSVYYTRQELVDDFHKYTPEVERRNITRT